MLLSAKASFYTTTLTGRNVVRVVFWDGCQVTAQRQGSARLPPSREADDRPWLGRSLALPAAQRPTANGATSNTDRDTHTRNRGPRSPPNRRRIREPECRPH